MGSGIGGDQASWNRSTWPLLGAVLGRGVLDGGDDLQSATALGALRDVDLEHSFEQPGPSAWGQVPRRGHLTVVR